MSDRSGLEVYSGTKRVGLLDRSDLQADSFLFTYERGCADDAAVSLTMPVVRDPYPSMSSVHPIFEMNLPEGALLEQLRLRFAKMVPDLDGLGLLGIVGPSQIGRLRFAQPGVAVQAPPAQSLTKLLTYKGAEDVFQDLLEQYAPYSGVSGVQPKILVQDLAELPRATVRGPTHIIKSFDPRQYPELAANEYFCLRAALHAGLPTVKARLSVNRRLLIIDRFDREADGAYSGVEDFCVLNGLRAHGRYHGSYEGIAHRIQQFVSPEQQRAALSQLFGMVALNCAVENGDAHLKNFAVTYAQPTGAVSLAPTYDVVATTAYRRRDVLALTLNDTKAFADRATLLRFGRRACNLTQAHCGKSLQAIEAGVRRAIRELRAFSKQHPDFRAAGDRLIEIFTRGLQRSITAKG